VALLAAVAVEVEALKKESKTTVEVAEVLGRHPRPSLVRGAQQNEIRIRL